MVRNTNYLRRFEDEITELSNKHGVSKQDVSDMIDSFFADFKQSIIDPRMPTVKITNLGTFKPTIGKINWQIRNSFRHYRAGRVSRETMVSRIQYLWPIKQRLMKEKAGISTWKEWRDKYKNNDSKKEEKR